MLINVYSYEAQFKEETNAKHLRRQVRFSENKNVIPNNANNKQRKEETWPLQNNLMTQAKSKTENK